MKNPSLHLGTDKRIEEFVKKFFPKNVRENHPQYSNYYLLTLTFLVAAFMEILMALLSVSVGFWEGAVVRGVAFLLLIVGLRNAKAGHDMTRLSYITMIVLGLVTSASIWTTGGLFYSPFSGWLSFTIIFGFMVIGRQGGLVGCVYILMLLGLQVWTFPHGEQGPDYLPNNIIELFEFCSHCIFIATNFCIGYFFNQEHITKNKLANTLTELRLTQQNLVRQEKLAALGDMTAGIAHELKNPLNFINNFAVISREMVDEYEAADEAAKAEMSNNFKANLDKVIEHGKRADTILKTMLSHSKRLGEKTATDMSQLVIRATLSSQKTAATILPALSMKIETGIEPELPKVNAVEHDIERVITNLIDNALYAVNERKNAEGEMTPMVRLTVESIKDEQCIHFTVTDNGTGMSAEIRSRIFDPFFTTKPPGQGTGLGLSLSHDIISRTHHGKIECFSEPGFGTRMDVYLPIHN